MSLYTRTKIFLKNTLARGSDVRFEFDAVASSISSQDTTLRNLISDNATAITALGGDSVVFPTAALAASFVADTSSSTTTYTGVTSPSASGKTISTNYPLWFKPANNNTGASTLNIASTDGALSIKKYSNGTKVALDADDLEANKWYLLVYDATDWVAILPGSGYSYVKSLAFEG